MTTRDERKLLARAWFESLRDRIMAAFEELEREAPPGLYGAAPGAFGSGRGPPMAPTRAAASWG